MTEAEAVAVAATGEAGVGADAPQQQAEEQEVYCICRRPEAGFMVFCDGCEDWFHGDCVGIKKRQADKLSKYLCPNCAPPTPSKASTPQTPDSETSKSRSGRSIKKKKWDEEEFEYDFKNKDEDEDYEEEEEEERPRKATPKKVATPQHHQPQQHPQQHQQQHHLQQQQQHQQQQHQQHQQMYYSPNNHYAHANHLNLVGQHPNHHTLPSYNLNPTLQAINSINSYALNPHGHMQSPSHHMQQQQQHLPPPPHHLSHAPLPHTLPHSPQPQQTMGQIPISGIQGPPPGSKRSYPTTPTLAPKPSPEAKPKVPRRDSYPPSVKG